MILMNDFRLIFFTTILHVVRFVFIGFAPFYLLGFVTVYGSLHLGFIHNCASLGRIDVELTYRSSNNKFNLMPYNYL